MIAEPSAALIDAGALVAALFAARLALLWRSGGVGWRGWTARWVRRGVRVALLVLALRLATLAMAGGERLPCWSRRWWRCWRRGRYWRW